MIIQSLKYNIIKSRVAEIKRVFLIIKTHHLYRKSKFIIEKSDFTIIMRAYLIK